MALARATMRVLGAAGGYPYGGHACSGFLVTVDDRPWLLDCGPGVAARLLALQEATTLAGVIVSHMHPDHMLDLVPLGYALLTEWIAKGVDKRVPVYLPGDGAQQLRQLVGLFGHRSWRLPPAGRGPGYEAIRRSTEAEEDWFEMVFDLRRFAPGDGWREGELVVRTTLADHTAPNAAILLDGAERRFVYTGDTRWHEPLCDFARDADLLIAEGHFSGGSAPGGGHMTPHQAGELASRANAKRLVLTHLAAAEDGPAALAAARSAYAGPVDLALELDEVTL